MKIISVETMRELDRQTIAGGTPGTVLMERAGAGVYREIIEFIELLPPRHTQKAAVIAGKGNNGGDAYVVARYLATETEIPTHVYAVCPPTELTGDARTQADALPPTVDITVCPEQLPEDAIDCATLVVDGLLGTGISGPLRPPCETIIGQINASGRPVVAIDIPSGLDGDTGEIATAAVQADLTVTMAQPKRGLLTSTGLACCGRMRCVDIGVPSALVAAAESHGEAIYAADTVRLLSRRPADSHKGTFGHVLVVGGSSWYVGAPVLSGTAALRSGCGLSTVAMPESARHLVTGAPQALIFRSIADDGTGFFTESGTAELDTVGPYANCLVLGPGIGRASSTRPVIRHVLAWEVPAVIDADALHLVAGMPVVLDRRAPTILTPHPGEMRALLHGCEMDDMVDAGRVEQAVALARNLAAYVVLKGLGTVIAGPDGRWAINTSGSSGLASAGTGDVLGGLIAGLLAQGFDPWDACTAGVFLHGRAAELSIHGSRALIADDLLDFIGPAFCDLTPHP
jgi:NAD(P)H-hydrate epimerase